MCNNQALLEASTYSRDDIAIATSYLEVLDDKDILELIKHIMINGGRVTRKRQRKGMYLSIF